MWCKSFFIYVTVLFSWSAAEDFSHLLPEGPGRMDVLANCGACHSFKLVASQRMSRDRWLKAIRWMQEKQNLWSFPPETEKSLLDYLAQHFGTNEASLAAGLNRDLFGGLDDLGLRAINPLP